MIDLNKELAQEIDDILSEIDINDVTSEDSGTRDELPDGYYLSELEFVEITNSKTSKLPMIALRFKTVENGIAAKNDDAYNTELTVIDKTANRKFGIYYVLKDEKSVKRAISDLLKFEDKEGPLLDKGLFTNYETLNKALQMLTGVRIYVLVSTTAREGKTSTWRNLVSWKRVAQLHLPE